MDFHGVVLLLSYHLCRSSVGADPVKVQTEPWGVAGTQQVEEEVLLSGVSLDQEFNKVLKNKSADSDPDIPRLEVLIPILAFIVFCSLSIISFLIYKWKGVRHPGGIIGSIAHYRRNPA